MRRLSALARAREREGAAAARSRRRGRLPPGGWCRDGRGSGGRRRDRRRCRRHWLGIRLRRPVDEPERVSWHCWSSTTGGSPTSTWTLNGPGRGLGSRLVNLAKELHPNGLDLWTFQSNVGARHFYERHGFAALETTDGANEQGARRPLPLAQQIAGDRSSATRPNARHNDASLKEATSTERHICARRDQCTERRFRAPVHCLAGTSFRTAGGKCQVVYREERDVFERDAADGSLPGGGDDR